MVKEERLDVLSSLAAGITVTYVTDGHTTRKLCHLLLIEDLVYQTITLNSVKIAGRADCNYTTALLTPMLKSMKTVICQSCSIFHTIDSKHSTFVMKFVVPVYITTLTHFVLS